MRVTKYDTITEDGAVRLVKESSHNYADIPCISSPADAAAMLDRLYHLSKRTEEVVYLVGMNARNKVAGVFELSRGTIGCSFCSPREAFVKLLACNACSFIVAHNHPSGSLEPSQQDLESCRKLEEAGEIIGCQMVDSLILVGSEAGQMAFTSLKEMKIVK